IDSDFAPHLPAIARLSPMAFRGGYSCSAIGSPVALCRHLFSSALLTGRIALCICCAGRVGRYSRSDDGRSSAHLYFRDGEGQPRSLSAVESTWDSRHSDGRIYGCPARIERPAIYECANEAAAEPSSDIYCAAHYLHTHRHISTFPEATNEA